MNTRRRSRGCVPCTNRLSPGSADASSSQLAESPGKQVHLDVENAKEDDVVSGGWSGRFQQLVAYRKRHGHTLVPRRYPENPTLGNWVNKQRQHYRHFLAGTQPCSLTPQRVNLLDGIGFCWNASNAKRHEASVVSQTRGYSTKRPGNSLLNSTATAATSNLTSPSKDDGAVDAWWSRLYSLRHLMVENNFTSIHLDLSFSPWLYQQRQAYQKGELTSEQVKALFDLDHEWWMSNRQWKWEVRYRELMHYIQQNGNPNVPISHLNQPLAHWVSTQRKQYNRLQQGKPSDMTSARFERLKAVGFVWNRWEYEFEQKHVALEDRTTFKGF